MFLIDNIYNIFNDTDFRNICFYLFILIFIISFYTQPTFGYDPLGSKENVSKSQTDPLRQGSKSKSVLSLEGLSDFLKPTSQIKSELLHETKSLSLLDEKNIID